MKNLTIIIITVLSLVSCSGGSGDKAEKTSRDDRRVYGDGGYYDEDVYYDEDGPIRPPNNCTGDSFNGSVGTTPFSIGESARGTIELGYNLENGAVETCGKLRLITESSSSNCTISAGEYDIDTRDYGLDGGVAANHYKNISIEARGSNLSFSGVIENALALQNSNKKWVQDVKLRVTKVNNNSCNNFVLSFAMPLQ